MRTQSILIVDDDPRLRRTLSDVLQVKGYAPISAATGKAALDKSERQAPAVALIDLKLDDMSGLEVMKGIKERSPDTECIVLTGHASQASAIEAVNLGAYSYMQKPYDVEQLLVTIRRAIEKREAEEALRESEERYRDLVEHSHDLLCTHDLEGQILSVNQGAAKLLGYDPSVLLKKNIRDILVPEVRDEFDTYLAIIQRRGVVSGLMLVQTSTGERRIWEYHNTLRTEGVAAPIVRGMAHDITERKRAEKERERRTRELAMLNEIGRAVTSSLDFKEVLALLLDRTHQGLGAEACSVALLDANGDLVFYHAEGKAAEAVIGLRLKPGQGIAGHVAQSGQSALVPDVHADPHFYGEVAPDFTTHDMVCVPLVARDEIIGVIELLNKRQGTFAEEDVRVLESVATQAATAIQNARLFELTQRQSERIAQALVVSESLHRGLVLEQVLEQVAQGAVKLGFRRAAINVCQLEEELVRIQAVAGMEGPEREMLMGATYHWSEFQTLMQERFRVSRSYLIRQGEVDWERDYQGVTVSSDIEDRGPGYWRPDDALLVPLWGTGGQPVGVLWVDEPVNGLLPDLNTIQTLEAFANQAAIAIENARLYQAGQRELAERKRAEEALRRSEEAHRLLFEQSVDGIILIAKGRIVRANHAFCAFHGLPVERVVGMNPLDLIHPEDRNIAAQRIEVIRSGESVPESRIYRALRADGLVFWVEVRSKRIDWEGEPALQTIVRDVTERVRAEEEIRKLNQFLDSVIDNANVWLNVLDEKANVVLWNKAAEEISGYSREEVVGHGKIWEWLYPEEKYRNRILAAALAIIEKGGDEEDAETTIWRKDGQTRMISWNSRNLVDEKGNPIGSIALGRDITERKQLEAQLRQAQKMTAIGQLAGGICHDFNNLLTPIGGFAELLLLKAPEDSQQREYLRQIKIAAERAAALTRQLRLFTRQAAGERHPVQLNSLVEETRELLERSIPKEITIELHLGPELWAVEADPSQISQVLMNLGVNARDAMSDGGTLTLETRNVTLGEEQAQMILDARPGSYVRLTVSDTGCGMSPEVQARLFEPFFTTKEVGKGTGLGLAVVYGIVKGHDGFIQVYSQEGQGSTFHVYLPAVESAVEEREVEGLELPTGMETILLVDDEEMVRALGQRVLELCGYTVLMAEDGLQALEAYQVRQGEIALVVLDVIMPQMGGLECLRRLRELDPQVKVLISTGYTAKGLAQELVAEGALGVVEKPFQIRDFAVAVRAAIDRGPKGFQNP